MFIYHVHRAVLALALCHHHNHLYSKCTYVYFFSVPFSLLAALPTSPVELTTSIFFLRISGKSLLCTSRSRFADNGRKVSLYTTVLLPSVMGVRPSVVIGVLTRK